MSRADWVTVIPEKGKIKETAQALLLLADPRDVLTQDNGTTFLVPQNVADAYHGATTEETPKPKRRARAKIEESEE